MIAVLTDAELEAMGYEALRRLPTGEKAGLNRYLFTVGIVTGIDDFGYRCRWCYGSRAEAYFALQSWDGRGDPPDPWIKQKGIGVERRNPLLPKEVA